MDLGARRPRSTTATLAGVPERVPASRQRAVPGQSGAPHRAALPVPPTGRGTCAGKLREVPSRGDWFGPLDDDDARARRRYRSACGAGWCSSNLDRDAEPLDDVPRGRPEDAAWADLDDFRCAVTTRHAGRLQLEGRRRRVLGDVPRAGHPARDARVDGRHSRDAATSGVARASRTRTTAYRARVSAGARTKVSVELRSCSPRAAAWAPEYAEPCPTPDDPERADDPDVDRRVCCAASTRGATASTVRNSTPRAMLRARRSTTSFPNATVLVQGEMMNVLLAQPGDDARRMPSSRRSCCYRAPGGAPRRRPVDVRCRPTPTSACAERGRRRVAARCSAVCTSPGLTHLVVSDEE